MTAKVDGSDYDTAPSLTVGEVIRTFSARSSEFACKTDPDKDEMMKACIGAANIATKNNL